MNGMNYGLTSDGRGAFGEVTQDAVDIGF